MTNHWLALKTSLQSRRPLSSQVGRCATQLHCSCSTATNAASWQSKIRAWALCLFRASGSQTTRLPHGCFPTISGYVEITPLSWAHRGSKPSWQISSRSLNLWRACGSRTTWRRCGTCPSSLCAKTTTLAWARQKSGRPRAPIFTPAATTSLAFGGRLSNRASQVGAFMTSKWVCVTRRLCRLVAIACPEPMCPVVLCPQQSWATCLEGQHLAVQHGRSRRIFSQALQDLSVCQLQAMWQTMRRACGWQGGRHGRAGCEECDSLCQGLRAEERANCDGDGALNILLPTQSVCHSAGYGINIKAAERSIKPLQHAAGAEWKSPACAPTPGLVALKPACVVSAMCPQNPRSDVSTQLWQPGHATRGTALELRDKPLLACLHHISGHTAMPQVMPASRPFILCAYCVAHS